MRGISSLGLCHPKYPLKRLINCFEDVPFICCGWLDKFFNAKSSRKAIKLMSLNKRKLIRVHIINGPGVNNRRTQPHEITYGFTHDKLVKAIQAGDERFLRKFRIRCRHIGEVASYAPGDTLKGLYISPWLEYQPIPVAVFRTLAEIVEEELKGRFPIQIVSNPVRTKPFDPYVTERHGDKQKTDIIDLDGLDYRDADMSRFADNASGTKMALIWSTDDNGHDRGESWKPPENRVNWSHPGKWAAYKRWVEG